MNFIQNTPKMRCQDSAASLSQCAVIAMTQKISRRVLYSSPSSTGRISSGQRPLIFDQYISTVVRRLWYSDHRTQRWHREILTEEVPDRESPGRSADNTERLLDLKSALSKLGPRQRSAVILRYLNDCTIEETARILGCDGRTVTSQTCRALATLRAIFPREDEASE